MDCDVCCVWYFLGMGGIVMKCVLVCGDVGVLFVGICLSLKFLVEFEYFEVLFDVIELLLKEFWDEMWCVDLLEGSVGSGCFGGGGWVVGYRLKLVDEFFEGFWFDVCEFFWKSDDLFFDIGCCSGNVVVCCWLSL